MTTITTWNLYRRTEDRHELLARFTTEEEARKCIPAAGGYGGSVESEKFTIYDKAEEWAPKLAELNEELRQKALDKLSDVERMLLNLPPRVTP